MKYNCISAKISCQINKPNWKNLSQIAQSLQKPTNIVNIVFLF